MISAIGNRTGGFTLIELIVVLAILAGLTAAFPIALDRLQPQRQTRLYAQRVAADLRAMRFEAMDRGHIAVLKIGGEGHSYEGAATGVARRLPDTLTIAPLNGVDPTAPVSPLRFFADGSSNGGVILISRAGQTTRIRVDAFTGRVGVE